MTKKDEEKIFKHFHLFEIMTDSDDDWFEKDLDEFVVKTPSSNVEHITVKKNVNKKENDVVTSPTAYFDSGTILVFLYKMMMVKW